MLAWEKIDNDKKFQNLVNDIFAIEIGKPGYYASSAYIGSDGGWDGRFDDKYAGFDGLSMVQAKWTTKSLTPAFNTLKKELDDSLNKAQTYGVKNLYFATNAELQVGPQKKRHGETTKPQGDHVSQLIGINKGRVDNLFIYHRDKLRPLIESSPWIRSQYFDEPVKPLFAPYNHYFPESEAELNSDIPLLERLEEISNIEVFLSGTDKVLVISAPQGEGKSRLLLEVAKLLNRSKDPEWKMLFCRPSHRLVEDAIQDELNGPNGSVLCLDNADMYEDVAKKLLDVVRHSGNNIKLIFTTRTPEKQRVKDWLQGKRINQMSEINIHELSDESLTELLFVTSGKRDIEHPDRIIKELNRNPQFIIAYGKEMVAEESFEIRNLVLNLLDDASRHLLQAGFNEQEAKKLLGQIAAIVPFKLESQDTLKAFSSITNKSVEEVEKAINTLVGLGILRFVGATVRFSSDLNGNIFLSTLIDKTGGDNFLYSLFEHWMPLVPKNLALNVLYASNYTKTATIKNVCVNIVNKLVNRSSNTTFQEDRLVVDWIQPLVFLAPEEVTNLLYTFIGKYKKEEIDRDKYGPIIESLLRVPGFQKNGINLLRIIAERGITGTYHNYEPETLVRNAASPIWAKNINICIYTIESLDAWIEAGNLTREQIDLIVYGVGEALRGSHEYTDSYANKITVGRKRLIFSAKIGEYRALAMTVLKKIINSADKYAQIKSLKVFDDIGYEADPSDIDMWTRILEDKNSMLSWIDELIDKKIFTLETLAEAEDLLMRLWANNEIYPNLSARAENILLKLERPPELQALKLLDGSDFIVSNFEAIKNEAPDKGRWSWLVHNHMKLGRVPEGAISKIVTELSEKYKTSNDILEYLIRLDQELADSDQAHNIPLVESWSDINPESFLEIAKNEQRLKRVPERFKSGVMSIGAKNINGYVQKYAEALINKKQVSQNEINRLLYLLLQSKVSQTDYNPWLEKLVTKLDSYGIRIVLYNLYHLYKQNHGEDVKLFLQLVHTTIKQSDTKDTLEASDFLIRDLISDGLDKNKDFEPIRDTLILYLRDTPRFDYRENDLLSLLIEPTAEALCDFIEYRLKKYKYSKSLIFDPIPYKGFDIASEIIKAKNQAMSFLEKIINWRNDDLLSSYDIGHLLKNIPDYSNLVESFIRTQLQNPPDEIIENVLTAMYGLSFGKDTIDIYLEVLKKFEDTQFFERVQSVFVHKVYSGEYSSTIGEVPPALASKRDTLSKMYEVCEPGKAKSLLKSLEEGVQKMIDDNLKEAEEILDPR